MTRPTAAARACAALAVTAAATAVGVAAALVPGDRDASVADMVWVGSFLVFALVGAVLAARRPENAIGWLLLLVGTLVPCAALLDVYAYLALASPHAPLPGGGTALVLQSLLFTPAFAVATGFVPLLFPDGRLPSRRWRPVAGVGVAALVANTLASAVEPGPVGERVPADNPWGVAALGAAARAIEGVTSTALLGLSAAGVAAVVVRWRRGSRAERHQLRPFLAAVAALVVLSLVGAAVDAAGVAGTDAVGMALLVVAIAAVPLSIALAVLRHGLYGIDVVLNRALVFAPLTAGVLACYVGVVTLAGALIGDSAEGPSRLVATAAVAVAFQPARERLQRRVDRIVYGDTADPYAVVTGLGQRLEADAPADEILPRLAHGVRDALGVGGVAVETASPQGPLSTTAGSLTGRLLRYPMVHRGEQVGELVVAPGANAVTAATERLYADVARQCAAPVHAAALAGDLQTSRRRLVSAREDERRRVRRELHDRLGPTLAALRLQLESAADVVTASPSSAREVIVGVADELGVTLSDVRRLVYELRPPVLDELGLLPALRQSVAAFDRGDRALQTTVEAPESIPPLPAAVEVAAYRIVTEAVANAWRHADARTCRVRVSCNGLLEIEVADDGRGLGDVWRPGVGVLSMRERAQELGGWCDVASGERSGTTVRVRLPLEVE